MQSTTPQAQEATTSNHVTRRAEAILRVRAALQRVREGAQQNTSTVHGIDTALKALDELERTVAEFEQRMLSLVFDMKRDVGFETSDD